MNEFFRITNIQTKVCEQDSVVKENKSITKI